MVFQWCLTFFTIRPQRKSLFCVQKTKQHNKTIGFCMVSRCLPLPPMFLRQANLRYYNILDHGVQNGPITIWKKKLRLSLFLIGFPHGFWWSCGMWFPWSPIHGLRSMVSHPWAEGNVGFCIAKHKGPRKRLYLYCQAQGPKETSVFAMPSIRAKGNVGFCSA